MDVSWMTKYIAEALGTMLLVLIGNGTIAGVTLKGSKNEGMGGFAISWGYGIGLMIPVLAFANISGAHINPAITLGLSSVGYFPWEHVAPYILSQFIGAIIGQLLVVTIYKEYLVKTNNPTIALGAFASTSALDDGKNRGKALRNGFVNEAIGTFILTFGILSFTTNFFGAETINWMTALVEKQGIDITSHDTINQVWSTVSGASSSKMVGALAIGLMLVGLGTAFGGPTGAALNPARDLGPRLIYSLMPKSIIGTGKDSKWWYAWVPIAAPILGAVLAASLFKLMFK